MALVAPMGLCEFLALSYCEKKQTLKANDTFMPCYLFTSLLSAAVPLRREVVYKPLVTF